MAIKSARNDPNDRGRHAEPGARSARPGEPLARVIAFELGEWDVIGEDLRLELEGERTVLVGRNGAGKSALLDGIVGSAAAAVGPLPPHYIGPKRFRCEIDTDRGRFAYQFHCSEETEREAPQDSELGGPSTLIWTEVCSSLDDESKEIWRVDRGTASFRTKPQQVEMKFQPTVGALSVVPSRGLPIELGIFRRLFRSIVRVRAGVPRAVEERELSLITKKKDEKYWSVLKRDRVNSTTVGIMNWWQNEPDRFDEFVSVGQRIGIFAKVDPMVIPRSADSGGKPGDVTDFGFVSVDSVDIGMLSDGTLRVMELLRYILSPVQRLLLIEEPETSLHPGLLERVLAELKAYSARHQTILATHSPQVVSSALPRELRLLTRTNGRTELRTLTDAQTSRVADYLCDEGHLGDFVFSGAADD